MHPDFAVLAESWKLALDADGYAANTLTSYERAMRHLAEWLAEEHPGVGPADVTRTHIRSWIIHVRDRSSSGTARSWFAGIRKFYRWAVEEGEVDVDPTEGIRTPAANDPTTPVLTIAQVRDLLGTCGSRTFIDRRDAAIIYVFVDGGLRLAEMAGLQVADVDTRDRLLFVEGKGTNRSGPRRRAVPLGVKATRALDRYLRERRRHPYAELPQLWLGARGQTLGGGGVKRMIERRGELVGLDLHPHMFRHTWASEFRKAGGNEGDLMVLGGWRNRAMLDRYGKVAAGERAQEAYRRLALGDRI
ncbi:tyrosine-type recombinase/integrase [Micromonospora okii]|uniref:tyrosine-type recombinase/integrase n=1 Tax=Micromonospora okii TaxID=1182970 RepID=UPI001E50859A|nr:tyrosine-type recombinase/integrase [Micromonospora okii]